MSKISIKKSKKQKSIITRARKTEEENNPNPYKRKFGTRKKSNFAKMNSFPINEEDNNEKEKEK